MKKVLVVEDSRFFIQVVRRGIVDQLGYDMLHAATMAEARDILRDHADDILIALLDMHLPDAHNGEVIDVVTPYRIPCVVFTGSFSDELRELVLSKNAVDYITKDAPGNFELVMDLVQRISRNQDSTILIVDDSRVSRQYMRELLTLHRFTVMEASNGDEALKIVAENPQISMAIVDYNMPGMSGVDLSRKIRATRRRHEMVIIGVSAYGNNIVSAQFMKSGANDYLNKPFVPEEFFCRLYQNLDQIERIAAMQKAENALKHSAAAAMSASDAKSEFISHLNHELRTPLNGILGYAQLLSAPNSSLNERERKMAGNILNAGRHMLDLVTDVLELARIEAGKLDLEEDVLSLSEIAAESCEMLAPAAEAKKLKLTKGFSGQGFEVTGDRRRLKQVIVNLLSNAVKFTPEGGAVRVAVGLDDQDNPVVAVNDSGPGMSRDDLATALTPFGQTGPSGQRSQGTGLGLPLSKSLIELHQGELLIDTRQGFGSTFTMVLPAARRR